MRLQANRFHELFALFSARGIVTRRLECMFYGLAEFEITDPDGYVICLSQLRLTIKEGSRGRVRVVVHEELTER